MSRKSLRRQPLKGKQRNNKTVEETHPLTKKTFEMALKKVSRRIKPF